MRSAFYALAVAALALSAAGCATADDDAGDGLADTTAVADPMATPAAAPVRAELTSLSDSGVAGEVTFTPDAAGLRVAVRLSGLTPGEHGFHVHENGSCAEGEDGTPGGGAGGHYAPIDSPHGGPTDPMGRRHAGDFGNLLAGPDGTVDTTFTDTVARLDGERSIAGKAVVVHAGADDLESQPSGESGDRVACGVIPGGAAAPADTSAATP